MIPVYRPQIGDAEKRYVNEALDSTWISSKGEFIDRFERGFSRFVECRHGIGTCNGTVSLHLAFQALGIGPGDEVIVPTLTYVASANAISYTGASPVFVDSEPQYWNIDASLIEEKITDRTKAIEVVHLYGHPAEMDAVMSVADRYGIPVIEDAAEAHGAEHRGRRVGGIGHAASFSFFGNKIITTGEGGMIVTNDDEFARACRHLRGQGVLDTKTYWHDVVGFNYRMTNIAAAIGVAQLERAEAVIERKRAIAAAYRERLAAVEGVSFQREAAWARAVYWMVSIEVSPELRDPLRGFLASEGVETRPFFYPAHVLPMYRGSGSFPVAERLSASGVNLPSFPDLTEDEIDTVCSLISRFMRDPGSA